MLLELGSNGLKLAGRWTKSVVKAHIPGACGQDYKVSESNFLIALDLAKCFRAQFNVITLDRGQVSCFTLG